jgi:glycosyltransferase involved in cell wall biosynthesis
MTSSSDRPPRIGVVPVLDGSGGGIYQYSVTMLEGLLAVEPRPELLLLADRRSWVRAEAWRARGYQVVPLWPQTLRSRLGAAVRRVLGSVRVGKAATYVLVATRKRRTAGDAEYGVRTWPALGEWIARFGVDFLVLPAPSTVGFESGVPYVMAVHDLQHRRHPEFPEVSAHGEWDRREYLFRNGISHALTVLVDSEVGRQDVLEAYGDLIPSAGVQVLPFLPAPYLDASAATSDAVATRDRLGLPERYLLFPAQFWPHKNHLRVVQALAQIRAERGIDVNVVMCGSAAGRLRASVLAKVRRTATEEGVENLIRLPGYVEDDLMASLYAASNGVILPTFFGPTNIPILEAWAFGVPVLTSDIRGIREQCGDAAILVDPNSVRAIADGIYSLWSDDRVRSRLVSAGRNRLARYGHGDYIARLSAVIQDATRRSREASPARLAEPI